MTDRKIIAVVGATGAQGGGLVRAILADPDGEFLVRAITRNANSDKAREVARLGAEVATVDIDNEESIKKALQGVYGTFLVTFFWARLSPEREKAEARNLARAAKSAGVKHVIWSTLEDTRHWIPLSDDRMPRAS
ncbi:MAG TPA: NmrA family NAD(P)-binding protein [Xanthobacteraceae bacterium]